MASAGVIFDRDSAERIAAAVRRLEQTVFNAKTISQRNKNQSGHAARPIGFGVTATNAQYPDYPTIAADTYVIKKQEWFFDEVPGLQEVTRLDRETVVAHRALEDDDTDDILPEGTAVILWQVGTRKGARYWFYAIAPPNSSSSSESSSEESSSEESSESSSEESSSVESSSSEPSSESPCPGTCTWTGAILGIVGKAPLEWVTDDKSNCDSPCMCTLPTRSPDFVGDVQVTNCGLCRGCGYYFLNDFNQAWFDDPANATACTNSSCPGQCPPKPTEHPGSGSIPVVVTTCGGTLP